MIKNYAPLSFFVDKLLQSINFKFLRFGDGEFFCARGLPHDLGDGEHEIFPEVVNEYRNILKNLNPKHYNAIQGLVSTIPEIQEFIPDYKNWYYADVLHYASIKGEIYPFFKALNHRITVIIGNERTKKINYFINYSDYICIRDISCYYDYDFVLEKINEYPAGTIFVLAASLLSVPLIYHTKREDCTFIDVGSLFEPYIKSYTRTYHSEMSQETINKNLGLGI